MRHAGVVKWISVLLDRLLEVVRVEVEPDQSEASIGAMNQSEASIHLKGVTNEQTVLGVAVSTPAVVGEQASTSPQYLHAHKLQSCIGDRLSADLSILSVSRPWPEHLPCGISTKSWTRL